jgi:hypothetical protein
MTQFRHSSTITNLLGYNTNVFEKRLIHRISQITRRCWSKMLVIDILHSIVLNYHIFKLVSALGLETKLQTYVPNKLLVEGNGAHGSTR